MCAGTAPAKPARAPVTVKAEYQSPRRNLPPRNAPATLVDDSNDMSAMVPVRQRQELLPSKHELKALGMELEAKTQELVQATRQIEQLQDQLQGAQVALATERREMRDTRAQLLDAQMTLQQKDEQLRGLYENLLDATKERGDLRKQLITTQQQLKKTEAELTSWTEGLFALKTVIDSMDDEEDLNGHNPLNGHANGRFAQQRLALPSTTELLSKPDESAALLEQLAQLSRNIVADCEDDERTLAELDKMESEAGHGGLSGEREPPQRFKDYKW